MTTPTTLANTDARIGGFFSRLHAGFDRWLAAPMPGAAGRLGLFRALYALFFLWHLSNHQARHLALIPEAHREPMVILKLLTAGVWPSAGLLGLVESVLAGLLVVLFFGLFTKAVTWAVLGVGLLHEAWFFAADQEHATLMVAFYLPLFMAITGAGWGDTYSLDAARRLGRGGVVPPAGSLTRHVVPLRLTLVVLCVLIFFSGLFKIAAGGTWLSHEGVLSYLFIHKNIEAAREGLWANPLAPTIARYAWLGMTLQYATLVLELSFPVALAGRRIRHVYLASILIFHSVNAIWMATTFTAFLVVYGLFVDWEWLRRRLGLRFPITRLAGWPGWLSVGLPVAAGVLIAALWNAPLTPRAVLNVGGWLDWQTIWWPVLPLSLAWLAVASWRLVRDRRP